MRLLHGNSKDSKCLRRKTGNSFRSVTISSPRRSDVYKRIGRSVSWLRSKPLFTDEDRLRLRKYILLGVISATKDILRDYLEQNPLLDSRVRHAAHVINNVEDGASSLNNELAAAITVLWEDLNFRDRYERSRHLSSGVEGNAIKCKDYPFWGGRTWLPSNEDIMRCNTTIKGIRRCLVEDGPCSCKLNDSTSLSTQYKIRSNLTV
mmetsp:Transcript_3516/g.4414  ORF Transcript_3516/g.4414 Transcript_3516/m.4414 type:complete len:206 (+) Transcript_3516:260-877(+)